MITPSSRFLSPFIRPFLYHTLYATRSISVMYLEGRCYISLPFLSLALAFSGSIELFLSVFSKACVEDTWPLRL